jgi:hypothetical protein
MPSKKCSTTNAKANEVKPVAKRIAIETQGDVGPTEITWPESTPGALRWATDLAIREMRRFAAQDDLNLYVRALHDCLGAISDDVEGKRFSTHSDAALVRIALLKLRGADGDMEKVAWRLAETVVDELGFESCLNDSIRAADYLYELIRSAVSGRSDEGGQPT